MCVCVWERGVSHMRAGICGGMEWHSQVIGGRTWTMGKYTNEFFTRKTLCLLTYIPLPVLWECLLYPSSCFHIFCIIHRVNLFSRSLRVLSH